MITNTKRRSGRFVASLVASVALIAILPATAFAQDIKPGDVIDLIADSLTYDGKNGIAVARGRVRILHEGYELTASEVRYDERSGIVAASGGVRIVDPEGNVLMVDSLEVDDTLREGFISNVRFVLSDGSRLAATSGERFGGRRTTLNNAVYTPCAICLENPDKTPVWQLKAVRVVHDQEKHRLYYKSAFLEIFGVPVAYLPYLSHPDPTLERASGFLVPEIRQTQELGVALALPYHYVFSPSSDITVTPIITTKEGLVLRGEHRRHLGFGQINVDASVTYADQRDENNIKTGKDEFRGHFFSDGTFRHSDIWRSSYQIQLASDDTFMRRYGFSKLDSLTNDYHAEGFYGRSYASVRALSFTGLRLEDVGGLTPFALPYAQYDYVGKPMLHGGQFRANFSALALNRTNGQDTQRVSATTSYELPFTNQLGQQFRLGAHIRTDLYNVSDAGRSDLPVFAGQNGTKARFLPHLEVEVSWPFAKISASSQQIIEPVFTMVVAPNGGNPLEIPNEDSRTFELTDVNLLAANRFPGIDRWEGGTRFNYGLRWSVYGSRVQSEVMIGQSFRFNDAELIFPDGSGLSESLSDFVGKWNVTIDDFIDLSHRFRLDKDTLRVRRNEIDASFGSEKARLTVGYFQLNRNRQNEGLLDREEVRASARYRIKGNWTLFGDVTRNLTGGSHPIAHGLGLLYTDECLEISLAWQKSFTADRDFNPGTSVMFRISLKHLG